MATPAPSHSLPAAVVAAIERDDVELVSSLRSGDWVGADGSGLQTALAYAAKCGAVSIVSWLISLDGVDPNVGRRATSPLCAAAANGHLGVVDLLLRDGRVDPNRRRQDGVTPLVIAVQQGHLSVTRRLLGDARTDLNVRTLYPLRLTALLVALRQHDEAASHTLLSDPRCDLEASKYEREDVARVAASLHCPPTILAMLQDRAAKGALSQSLQAYRIKAGLSPQPDTRERGGEETGGGDGGGGDGGDGRGGEGGAVVVSATERSGGRGSGGDGDDIVGSTPPSSPSPTSPLPHPPHSSPVPRPPLSSGTSFSLARRHDVLHPSHVHGWPRERLVAELVSLSHRCAELESQVATAITMEAELKAAKSAIATITAAVTAYHKK